MEGKILVSVLMILLLAKTQLKGYLVASWNACSCEDVDFLKGAALFTAAESEHNRCVREVGQGNERSISTDAKGMSSPRLPNAMDI